MSSEHFIAWNIIMLTGYKSPKRISHKIGGGCKRRWGAGPVFEMASKYGRAPSKFLS